MTHPDCYPDYVNGCAPPISGVSYPKGQDYYQYPHSGNGMMHMRFYDDGAFEPGTVTYDYLQGRLYRPLDSGRTYCVSFYASLTKWSLYAVNNLGAYLDDGSIDTASDCGSPKDYLTPTVNFTTVITDTTGWTLISGSFTAKGTEKFITIGNFFDTLHTNRIVNYLAAGHVLGWAYYLIDDVSVIAVDDTANAGPDAVTTPMGDSVWVGDTTGYLPCYWYANGVLVDSNKAGFKVLPDTTTTYVLMLNVCGNVTYDSATVYVFPTGVQENARAINQRYALAPNPTKGDFVLTQGVRADGVAKVEIWNAIGVMVENVTLDFKGGRASGILKNPVPGVYTMRVAAADGSSSIIKFTVL